MNKLKILLIINNLGPGGAEKLLEESLPLLNQEKDIEVELLLLTDDNNVFYDSLAGQGIKIRVIKHKNINDPRNIIAIKKHIEVGQYDVIHSHLFPAQYWAAIAKLILKNKKIRFITTEHSTHNRRREKIIFRPIDKFIYRQYDTIISITEETKENLIKWIKVSKKNLSKHIVVKNGVNLENIRKALPYKKEELIEGIAERSRLVCMVGRFAEAKDQPTLIRAMKFLPNNIHLVLVGEGPLIGICKDITQELDLEDRIHFLGFRHDVARILKTIDIVVQSSNWEGFGLVAVEGMAAGRPVIASDIEGLREVVGDAGILFELGNEIELAEQITVLINDLEEYKYRVELCKNKAKEYDIKSMVSKYIECYQGSCAQLLETALSQGH